MISETRKNTMLNILDVPARGIKLLHRVLTRIFPPSGLNRAGSIYVETLGLTGLFLYLFNINLSGSLHENGETMLIIAFLLAVASWGRILVRQPLFWLMIAFVVVVIISTIIGIQNFPAGRHESEAKKLIRFALFIPLAWWIGGNPVSIRNAFLILCIGFVLSSLPWVLNWDILGPMFEGRRPETEILGMGTARYGTWIGFLLVGTVLLGKNFLPQWMRSGKISYFGYAFYFFVVACMTIELFVIASRAMWIAAVLCITLGLVLIFFLSFRSMSNWLHALKVPAVIFILFVVFAASQYERIENRFSIDASTISHVLSGRFDQVEKRSSLGIRIQMYMWSIENHAYAKPFGWGPRSLATINRNKELREQYNWHFGHNHFHSDFFNVSFQIGVAGTLILALVVLIFIKKVYSGYSRGIISDHCFALFLMIILYTFIVGLANSNFMTHAYMPVLGAIIFSNILGMYEHDQSRS